MRLGSPLGQTWNSPDEWIATLGRRGFGAAYWPLGDEADDATIDAYAAAARAADIVIAEVGAWHANPISPDDATRARGLETCTARLALAERVGARCCVNVAGSRGDTWDGPHADNLGRDTFALIVDSVREIVDAVLTELSRLDPDTPILVEHLSSDAEYEAAVAHVRSMTDDLGLRT